MYVWWSKVNKFQVLFSFELVSGRSKISYVEKMRNEYMNTYIHTYKYKYTPVVYYCMHG